MTFYWKRCAIRRFPVFPPRCLRERGSSMPSNARTSFTGKYKPPRDGDSPTRLYVPVPALSTCPCTLCALGTRVLTVNNAKKEEEQPPLCGLPWIIAPLFFLVNASKCASDTLMQISRACLFILYTTLNMCTLYCFSPALTSETRPDIMKRASSNLGGNMPCPLHLPYSPRAICSAF